MPTLDDVQMEDVTPGAEAPSAPAPVEPAAALPPGVPDWAIVPVGFKFPRGKQVIFVRIQGALTDVPEAGDRVAILWSLTVGDERLARQRATATTGTSTYEEFAKQMIRTIDGDVVDWSKGPYQVSKFWEAIGPKYRSALHAIYLQFHSFTDEERARFFGFDIAVKTGI